MHYYSANNVSIDGTLLVAPAFDLAFDLVVFELGVDVAVTLTFFLRGFASSSSSSEPSP